MLIPLTAASAADYIPVAQLPCVQRDLYLARALATGKALSVSTLNVHWPGARVEFASDEPVSSAVVSVAPSVSVSDFARLLEQALDCWASGEGEWVLKWADRISKHGSPDKVRLALCDRIASLDAETGETVGALKRKRRSVSKGYGTVRLVPAQDSLQIILRHPSAEGLKALWKSVLHRLERVRC